MAVLSFLTAGCKIPAVGPVGPPPPLVRYVYQMETIEGAPAGGFAPQLLAVLERRIDSLNLTWAQVEQRGADEVVIALPASEDHAALAEQLTVVGKFEIRGLEQVASQGNPAGKWRMQIGWDEGTEEYEFQDAVTGERVETSKVLEESVHVLDGRNLKTKSQAQIMPTSGEPVVAFKLDRPGTKAFADYTMGHINEFVAIVVDGKILSAPIINEPITQGSGIISGGFTDMQGARILANLLNSGALPVPLKLVEVVPDEPSSPNSPQQSFESRPCIATFAAA